jgi:hypothetical protein
MPPQAALDFIKSHKITVGTANGETEVNLFRWNEQDRAWGMQIPYDRDATKEANAEAREAARQTAKGVFDQVVEIVRTKRKEERAQSGSDTPDRAVDRLS